MRVCVCVFFNFAAILLTCYMVFRFSCIKIRRVGVMILKTVKHYSSLKDSIKHRDLNTEVGIRSKLELSLDSYLTTEAGTLHSQLELC